MVFAGCDFFNDTGNILLNRIRDPVERTGDLRPRDQHQFGMTGRFSFGRKDPAQDRDVFQKRDARHTADHVGSFDAADDKFPAFVADLDLRFKFGLVQTRRAVAVPAEQTGSGDFDRQDGSFSGNDRRSIQLELESVGSFCGLSIPMFECEIRSVRKFGIASLGNFVIQRGVRDRRLLLVEKSRSNKNPARPVEVRKSKYLLFHLGLKLKKSVRLECEPSIPAANVFAQLLR